MQEYERFFPAPLSEILCQERVGIYTYAYLQHKSPGAAIRKHTCLALHVEHR